MARRLRRVVALRKLDRRRDLLGFHRYRRKIPMQCLAPVEVRDRQLPNEVVEVARITPSARLHGNDALEDGIAVDDGA
jgi:hypothetical protein